MRSWQNQSIDGSCVFFAMKLFMRRKRPYKQNNENKKVSFSCRSFILVCSFWFSWMLYDMNRHIESETKYFFHCFCFLFSKWISIMKNERALWMKMEWNEWNSYSNNKKLRKTNIFCSDRMKKRKQRRLYLCIECWK